MVVSEQDADQMFVYTDAAYEILDKTGSIGAVLVDTEGNCVESFGFGFKLDAAGTGSTIASACILG